MLTAIANVSLIDVRGAEQNTSEFVTVDRGWDAPPTGAVILSVTRRLKIRVRPRVMVSANVSLSVDCDVEDVDEVYGWAQEWANGRVSKEVHSLRTGGQ